MTDKDVGSKAPEHAYSVDIRGDNNSFEHGTKYLVKHEILG